MNFKDAQKLGKLEQFAKEHEITDPHPDGWERFEALLDLLTGGKAVFGQTSAHRVSVGYARTKTRRGTS